MSSRLKAERVVQLEISGARGVKARMVRVS